MKLSARNQINGTIAEVRKGRTTVHVRIGIGNGVVITRRSPTRRSTNWASKPATRRVR